MNYLDIFHARWSTENTVAKVSNGDYPGATVPYQREKAALVAAHKVVCAAAFRQFQQKVVFRIGRAAYIWRFLHQCRECEQVIYQSASFCPCDVIRKFRLAQCCSHFNHLRTTRQQSKPAFDPRIVDSSRRSGRRKQRRNQNIRIEYNAHRPIPFACAPPFLASLRKRPGRSRGPTRQQIRENSWP